MDTTSAARQLQAIQKLVATRLARVPLDTIATAINKDDTQASRIRSGELGAKVPDVIAMLYAAGLKCVDATSICVDRVTYEAMTHIASKAMADRAIARQLVWNEEAVPDARRRSTDAGP